MFDALSERFDGIFRRLRSRGKLTPTDVDEVAREIRLALLEADVNVRVVKSFIARLKERATGAEVAESLSPGQQVIKIVHEELVATLGGAGAKLRTSPKPPTVIVLAGLQGSGKTTAAAKLARLLEHQQSKRVLLVAADLQRPAAVDQLVRARRPHRRAGLQPGDRPGLGRTRRARRGGATRPEHRDRRHRRSAPDRRRADDRARARSPTPSRPTTCCSSSTR